MKIACIIHSLDGGGSERVMAALSSRLANRGNRVVLITLDDGSHERHAVDPGVVHRRLNVMCESPGLTAKFLNTRRRVRELRAAIEDASPDVVLSFCDRTNILTLMATRTLDVPVVISERSDPSQQKLGTAWEYLRGQTYGRATSIVALTDMSASHLRARFRVPVVVIPSGVDEPPGESDRRAAAGHRLIVGVGRLEIEKGFDRLIDAFAILAPDYPDWSLRILGEGSMRGKLEAQIRDLGLDDRITMPGWIRPVWDEVAAATIFALPSRYEGFPSALLEAMALGVPSVAVDCESGPRAVISSALTSPPGDSPCGLLTANDTESLARGIRRLVEEGEFRERLGLAGKSVVERFSWDEMVDAYERTLRRAADATKPQR